MTRSCRGFGNGQGEFWWKKMEDLIGDLGDAANGSRGGRGLWSTGFGRRPPMGAGGGFGRGFVVGETVEEGEGSVMVEMSRVPWEMRPWESWGRGLWPTGSSGWPGQWEQRGGGGVEWPGKETTVERRHGEGVEGWGGSRESCGIGEEGRYITTSRGEALRREEKKRGSWVAAEKGRGKASGEASSEIGQRIGRGGGGHVRVSAEERPTTVVDGLREGGKKSR